MSYDHTPRLMSWLETVEEHYGSLDRFPDAPTIRVQLDHTIKMILENEQFLAQMEGYDYDFTFWKEDLVFLRNLKLKLEHWLLIPRPA